MKENSHKKRLFLKGLFFICMFLFLCIPVLSFAGPTIFYTDVINGPNSGTNDGPGGCYLTIFGSNFGDSQGSSTVTIGGGAAGAYKYWSDTKVSVQLGSVCTSGDIVLTTSSGSATAPEQFTVNSGDIYFISLIGNDNDGGLAEVNNINKPYRSPNYVKALGSFGAGDWMVVRGGTYDLDDGNNNLSYGSWWRGYESGSANNDLVLMGYPGETVTLDIDAAVSIYYAHPDFTPSYWVVANFYIDASDYSGGGIVFLGPSPENCPGGSDICIDDPDSSEGSGPGRLVNVEIDGKDTGLMNCESGCNTVYLGYNHDVKVYGLSVHNTSSGNSGCKSHVLYLQGLMNNIDIGWCSLYNIAYSRGVLQVHQDSFSGKCWGEKLLTNIKIHNCKIYNTKGQPVLFDGGAGDIWFYNNIVYDATNRSAVYSDILALRGSGGKLYPRIYNNSFYVNPYSTGSGVLIHFGMTDDPEHVDLYNNIFYVTESQDAYFSKEHASWGDENITSDNNVWFGSSSGLPSFAGSNDKTIDPKFINAANGDLSIHSDSPCIGAATSAVSTIVAKDFDGISRPQTDATTGDTGYDIGAYEYIVYPPENLRIK